MNRRYLSIFVLTLLLFGIAQPFMAYVSASATTPDISWVKSGDEVVIRLKEPKIDGLKAESVVSALKVNAAASQGTLVKTLEASGAVIINQFWLTNAILVKVSDPSVLKSILQMSGVESIHPNFVVTVPPIEKTDVKIVFGAEGATPVNTWGINRIGAPAVWSTGVDGAGVKVAVLDTGVDISHPALAGKLVGTGPYYSGGWIEFNSIGYPVTGSTPVDTDGHGTHTSGTVLGGVAGGYQIGVAPGAMLMHARVLTGGSGTYAQIVAGMQWAISPTDAFGTPAGTPAQIVSMSFGADGKWKEFIPAIQNMVDAGVLPVCAIGNSGAGTSASPGNYYNSFGVGATDSFDNVASFSGGEIVSKSAFTAPLPPAASSWPTSWIKPDVSAPGVDILSSVPGGGLELWSGTSMAAPYVAGAAALLKQAHPDWSISAIINALQGTAQDKGDTGKDTQYGYGIINVYAANGGVTTDPKIRAAPASIDVIIPHGAYLEDQWVSLFNDGGSDLTFTISDDETPIPTPTAVMETVGVSSDKAPEGVAVGAPVTPKVASDSIALVVKDNDPWESGAWPESGLVSLGIPYDIITSSMFASQSLTSYKFIVIASDQGQAFYDTMALSSSKLEAWVAAGGKLEVHACDVGHHSGSWSTLLPGGVDHVGWEFAQQNHILLPSHPVVQGLTDSDFYNWNYVSHGYFTSLPAGTQVIMGYYAEDGVTIKPTVIEYSYGAGKVVATMQTWEWCKQHGYNQNGKIIDNTMYYLLFGVVPNGWLTEYPFAGTIPAGGKMDIQLLINALTAPDGDYYATIHVSSNDPVMPVYDIPVHLHVGELLPKISVTSEELKVSLNPNQIYSTSIDLSNLGLGELKWRLYDAPAGPTPASKTPTASTNADDVKNNDDYVGTPKVTEGVVVTGDKLSVGISPMGELDNAYDGVGFHYLPADAYADGGPGSNSESLATGWNGEGYVVYYDGTTAYTYPSDGASGLVPVSINKAEDADKATVDVTVATSDGKLVIIYHFFIPKHDQIVIMSAEIVNNSTTPLGDIKYKRVVDWDCNGYSSDDINFDWDPEHYLLKADDYTTGDYPRSFSYGVTALYPRENVYDWDLNAWDDYTSIGHGDSYLPDGPVDGDYNVALYYNIGALMPGERKEIAFGYGVGEGNTPEESNADLIEKLGYGMEIDAPWLSETPTTGIVSPSGSQIVDVTFDTRSLDPGTYYAVIVVESNDPTNPVVVVPVTMSIRPGKVIIEDPAEGKNPDIVEVYEQLTEDAIILTTELANTPPYPMILITSLDTDGKTSTGARNRYANDIGADYMLYGIIGSDGVMSMNSYDWTTLKKVYPGVKFDAMAYGYYYLYKWEQSSGTWTQIFSSGVNVEADVLYHFWVPLVLMASDGDMSVVQCAGKPMKIVDWAPDTGHGKTMPLRNIDLSSLWTDEGYGWTDLPVELHAIVKNEGEKPETFTLEFYAKRTGIAPLAAAPPATSFYTKSVFLEPNTQASVTATFTTATSGTYEMKAVVPAVGKETNSTDNQKVISYVVKASHDLAATAITTTPSPYLKQPDAKVLVTIVNQGMVAEVNKQVEVKVNDKVIGTVTFSCGVGETVVVQAPWVPDKVGAAKLKATIKTIAGEDDTTDNVVTGSATVINGRDLKVDSITIVNADPAKTKIEFGDDVNVTVVVKNVGGMPESNATLDFFVDGAAEGSEIITGPIAAGGTATLKFIYNIAKLGDRKVKAVVTPQTGMTSDINQKDNTLEKTFKAEGIDLAVKSIATTPAGSPKKGTGISIVVVIENRGSSKVSTAGLTVKVLGAAGVEEKMFAKTNIIIDVGKTATVTFTGWKPTTAGSRTIRAEVTMGGDAIPENNILEQPIVIVDRTWKLVYTSVTSVKVNNAQTATFQLCDADGNPLEIGGVALNLSATYARLGATRIVTNELGQATVTYTPQKTGSVKIQARVAGADIAVVATIAVKR